MRINFDEVVAVKVVDEEVCMRCVTVEEVKGADPDDFTMVQELEDSRETFFCDRCDFRFN